MDRRRNWEGSKYWQSPWRKDTDIFSQRRGESASTILGFSLDYKNDWKIPLLFIAFLQTWYTKLDEKTVVSVDLLCSKCRKKVMKLISTIEGINSIVLDPSKSTATVIGEADPVRIIKQVRKFRRSAQITSIGPAKEEKKDEKKGNVPSLPSTCQRCNVWYAVVEDTYFNPCNIL